MRKKLVDQVRIIINRYLSGDLKLSISNFENATVIKYKENDTYIHINSNEININSVHYIKLELNQEETNEFKYLCDKLKEVSEKELLSFLQDFNNSSSKQTIF